MPLVTYLLNAGTYFFILLTPVRANRSSHTSVFYKIFLRPAESARIGSITQVNRIKPPTRLNSVHFGALIQRFLALSAPLTRRRKEGQFCKTKTTLPHRTALLFNSPMRGRLGCGGIGTPTLLVLLAPKVHRSSSIL